MSVKTYKKADFPVSKIRRYLEPGPVVLVSSSWNGKKNIMTMGWHSVLEFTPSLVGCLISSANRSFKMIRESEECVINIPTADMAKQVVGVGNTSGRDIDKFEEFGLTPLRAKTVGAPMIAECYASFEGQLAEGKMIPRYNLFIWEVVKAHVSPTPKNPRTMHYRGQGEFMIAGRTISLRDKFKPEML